MSFSFGFTNDDFSDDDIADGPNNAASQQGSQAKENPLDTLSAAVDETTHPKLLTLETILGTLKNVRLTFDNYTTPVGQNIIYRRELFDVKHQIMCEDDENSTMSRGINDFLIGEGNSDTDLKKNVYEGGLKSWECSYDTVDRLSSMIKEDKLKYKNFLELGCGTALPTCFLLMKRFQQGEKTGANYILSDFNYDVLRLVTIPNIIIHWASTLTPQKLHELTCVSSATEDGLEMDAPELANDEVLLTQDLIDEFIRQLSQFNISLLFISGSWGRQFNQLLENTPIDCIISSETIYSLDTLPVVAESVVQILSQANIPSSTCLIAAKNFYFGVGGSVVEFTTYVNNLRLERFTMDVSEINDSQLKRSMVQLTYN